MCGECVACVYRMYEAGAGGRTGHEHMPTVCVGAYVRVFVCVLTFIYERGRTLGGTHTGCEWLCG